MPSVKKTSSNKLDSKVALIIIVFILVLVLISLNRSWNKSREIENEITGLENEITGLETKNLELSQLIKYLNSSAYIEEKARTDLGLKKPGEKTVIISELTSTTSLKLEKEENQSNIKKWWEYFFSKE
jgi:cell division protein FtsL